MLEKEKTKRKKERRSPLAPGLITPQEAARRLRLNPVSIYTAGAGTESLKAAMMRRGKLILIRETAVDDLIIATINRDKHNRKVSIWNDELLTVEEAAALLSVSPTSIYGCYCGTERMTRVRFGRRVLLLKSEVEAMVAGKGSPTW